MAVTTASVTCHRGSTPRGGQHQRERVWGWLCGRHGCGAPPWSTAGAEGFKQQVAACNQPSARSSRSTQHNQPSIGSNRQQAAGSGLRAAAGPVLEAEASQAVTSKQQVQGAGRTWSGVMRSLCFIWISVRAKQQGGGRQVWYTVVNVHQHAEDLVQQGRLTARQLGRLQSSGRLQF